MRKLVSVLVILSLLAVLLPMPTTAALIMHESLSTADARIDEYASNGQFGGSAAIVGDVNGDGYDDYIVADRMNGTTGNAYLFWGRSTGFPTSASQANVTFYSESKTEGPVTVARIGDVNGDGIDDVIIGAPTMDKPVALTGAVYIFFGKHNGWSKYTNLSQAGAIIRGTQMMDEIGQVIAGVGDFNGDNYDDIVLGTVTKSGGGWAYLFFGKHFGSPAWNTSMNLTHAAASWHGKDTYSRAGYAVDGGDVNGDGFDDIVIGAPGSDFPPDNYKSPGYSYIIFGRKGTLGTNLDISVVANASLKGEHYDDYTGVSVAVLGDVNRDGFEDILTATVQNDEAGSMAGKAYLVFGHASGWSLDFNLSGSDASWLGEAANNQAGKRLAKAGDVNGDGYNDLLIAAPYNTDMGFTNQGQTYLILGKKNGWANNVALNNADASWIGEANTEWAPSALSGAGDINGDVVSDILFGVVPAGNPSKVYLVFPVKNKRPTEQNITKVELFTDAAMTKKAAYANTGDQIWVKLKALDADPAVINAEKVNINNWPQDFAGFTMIVTETGTNTGIFTGDFYIKNLTQPDLRWIKGTPVSRVRVGSTTNHSAFDEVSVGGALKIDSLTLIYGSSQTLYAMQRSYAIRVNVSDPLGHGHLDFVNISIPLALGHINFTWYHDSNSFWKYVDPNFYTILDGASFADNPSMNKSVVTFRVFFNWTFPDEVFHSFVCTVGTKDKDYVTKSITDAFRVETDLDFKGTLKVQNHLGKYLVARNSLLPNENITFTGAIVIYQGTTDQYPPNTAFDVVVTDTDDNTWVGPKSSGAYINIKAQAMSVSTLYDNFTVTIEGPPATSLNKTLQISFKVDGDGITFSDPSPVYTEWQTNKRVMARVNISDGSGSGVNANSIEYRTKPNGGQWSLWKNAELTGTTPQIQASALVDVTDGPANEIQWRATDAVGNLDPWGNKSTSPIYTIRVDTVAPTFSNLWPGSGNQSKNANVFFGVRIQDPWSFVNGSTVEYTVSTNDQVDWTSWTKANYSGIQPLFDVKANFTLLHGSKNYVRWRASDGRGNLAMSDPLQITVNLTPPKPANRRPTVPGVLDKTVNVGSTLIFTVNASDPDGDTMTFSLTDNPEGMSITPQGLLTFSPTRDQVGVHNVSVMVSDGKLNNTTSFKVTVALLKPTVVLNNPTLLQTDLKGKVTLTGTATGGVQGIAKVEYSIDNGAFAATTGTTSWSLLLKTTDLKNGKHNMTLRVTDGLGTTSSVNYDFTVKNKTKTGGGMGNMLPIILVVVVVLVVGAVIGAVLMMKKKKKPEPAAPAEAQTAAQAASAAYNPAPQPPSK